MWICHAMFFFLVNTIAYGMDPELEISNPYFETTQLHRAAITGNLNTLKFFLSVGLDINARDENGCTPLFLAVEKNQKEIVFELLNLPDIDVNISDKKGQTPLHRAAYNGIEEIVKALIAMQTFNYLSDNNGATPLHFAAYAGHNQIVKKLLTIPGVDINEQTKSGITALHFAAQRNQLKVLKVLLVNEKTKPNIRNNEDITPLHIAAHNGHLDAVETLLASSMKRDAITNSLITKIKVNAKTRKGMTPLHLAAHSGHKNIVMRLCECPYIEVGAVSLTAQTIFHIASKKGHYEIVENLMTLPAAKKLFNAGDAYGRTPLMLAAKYGHSKIVKLLVKHYPESIEQREKFLESDQYLQEKQGKNALHYAAIGGNGETIEELVHAGLSLKSRHTVTTGYKRTENVDHYFPLHLAINYENVDAVRTLIFQLIEPNNAALGGVLDHALLKGNTKIIRELMNAGAWDEFERNDNNAIRHSLLKTMTTKMIRTLAECGHRFDIRNPEVQRLLGQAFDEYPYYILLPLVMNHPIGDVDEYITLIPPKDFNTTFIFAAAWGPQELLLKLLNQMVENRRLFDETLINALCSAIRTGRAAAVEILLSIVINRHLHEHIYFKGLLNHREPCRTILDVTLDAVKAKIRTPAIHPRDQNWAATELLTQEAYNLQCLLTKRITRPFEHSSYLHHIPTELVPELLRYVSRAHQGTAMRYEHDGNSLIRSLFNIRS